MDTLLRKKRPHEYLRQIKCITLNDFSVCWINLKSFYHGLKCAKAEVKSKRDKQKKKINSIKK